MSQEPERVRVAERAFEPLGVSGGGRSPIPDRAPSKETDITAAYLATLYENRYFIAAATVIAVAFSVLYVVLVTPTWDSEVIVQLEDKSKTLAGLEDLASMFTERNPADSEIEILRSRSVIGSVVDQLNLTIESKARAFPLFGSAVARRYGGEGLAPPLLGLRSYAWGGEQLRITQLEVPGNLIGDMMDFVVTGARDYKLLNAHGDVLLKGEVGKLASSGDGAARTEMFVQRLVARPGARFHVRKRLREAVIDELRRELRMGERGKKTGIISIALSGPDPAVICSILDALAQSYVLQNVQRKSAEAAKTLEFIEQQLPRLKANVDVAEGALNDFQHAKGTVSLTAETEKMLNRSVEIEKALSDLDLQRADLVGRFTESHPLVAAVGQKREKLRAEKAALAAKMRDLPEQEIDSARLMRDVKAATELYTLLVNKAQELRVVKSGTIGNVRIVDAATRPYRPASPQPFLSCALGLVLGLAGSIGAVFIRRSIHGGLDDPDRIESLTGLPIYAAIPHSARQVQLSQAGARARAVEPLLAALDPADTAVEALRSLRTNLQFALVESPSNIIAIEGPSPGIGKSFLCANFAHVLASTGQRVLLIDCDLRRGHLHRQFGGERAPGLSEVLSGEAASLSSVVRPTSEPNLFVLTTGTRRANPSEMLGSPRLQRTLEIASKTYDVVIIDTAPVLAVTDAALIGRCAGINILVLRSGDHTPREIAQALKRLHQGGAVVKGIVINDAAIGPSRYSRYGQYGYYEYDYKLRQD
jgi:tyrosine-protein kinase Etk/Wzc